MLAGDRKISVDDELPRRDFAAAWQSGVGTGRDQRGRNAGRQPGMAHQMGAARDRGGQSRGGQNAKDTGEHHGGEIRNLADHVNHSGSCRQRRFQPQQHARQRFQ